MPTTTMAVSSPLNPNSTVSTQVSSIKDDNISVITTTSVTAATTQNHDISMSSIALETAQLSSPISNGDDESMIKATVNGNNNVNNGAISSCLSTTEHGSPKIASLHSSITIGTADIIDVDLNIKTNDMSCLNVVTSSPTVSSIGGGGGGALGGSNHFLNGSNGHLLMAQNSFQATPSPTATIDSPWSIGDDNAGGFVNYSSPNNGQLHKRPIMSHHGLSPNSSIARNSVNQQQPYVHYNKNNNGNSNNNNFTSPWSNHSGQNSSWQQQQQQMQLLQSTSSSSSSQMSLNAWNQNRGRSVPNLNPLSPHMMHQQRKHQNPTQYSMPSSASSLQQQHHQQQPLQGLSPNLNSPSKYRRSTSYPGKSQMQTFQMDIGTMVEDQSSYMNYQVSVTYIMSFLFYVN